MVICTSICLWSGWFPQFACGKSPSSTQQFVSGESHIVRPALKVDLEPIFMVSHHIPIIYPSFEWVVWGRFFLLTLIFGRGTLQPRRSRPSFRSIPGWRETMEFSTLFCWFTLGHRLTCFLRCFNQVNHGLWMFIVYHLQRVQWLLKHLRNEEKESISKYSQTCMH